MLIDLEGYYILAQIYLGTRLTVTFQNSMDLHDRKVLILSEVAGVVDEYAGDEITCLRIDENGGTFAHDLSLRLRRPEIANFPEAIIFDDKGQSHIRFRGCAKNINFRNETKYDIWL